MRSPFEQYPSAIRMAAGEVYRAKKEGRDPDPAISRMNLMPESLGSLSKVELQNARRAQDITNLAATMVGNLADIRDRIEQGSFVTSLLARVEYCGEIISAPYLLRPVLGPGQMIDQVRGIVPLVETSVN